MASWKKLAFASGVGVGAGALAWPRLRARSVPLPDPIAEARLEPPLPFRFHGTWWPAARI
jgi:hypothetical protein